MDQDSIFMKILGGAITLLSAGIVWLIRTVFTNNRRIILLEQQLTTNAQQHERMLEELKTIRSELHDFARSKN